jgi:4-alpha-glucanotransferase
MEHLFERAAQVGVETQYWDAFGTLRKIEPQVLSQLLAALAADRAPVHRILPRACIMRGDAVGKIRLSSPEGLPFAWSIIGDGALAQGNGISPELEVGRPLPLGIFRLCVTVTEPHGCFSEETPLIVCPQRAYQGKADEPSRMWALAVQLYAVRSRRNWGYGDFSDLLSLIDLAADCGASAVGLNPLHSRFEDRGEEPSPYYPNSRLFLSALYIDLEAIPEFPGTLAAGLEEQVARARNTQRVDYRAVAEAKLSGLATAYRVFLESGSSERRSAFERFRTNQSLPLTRFACFEFLRRKFARPWWEWPQEWRGADEQSLARLHQNEERDIAFFEFVQWVAHDQLNRCKARARARKMPIGLYLDVAVGARTDGFDAWCDQEAILPEIAVGAPPDALNRLGQNWGLAGFNPVGLERRSFEPFRQLLAAMMRYAGAVRLDHVLGLQRLYLIPHGMRADQGTYVRMPFKELLATTALASVQNECLVVGEDLGTVPERFRETLADWGIWSYHVMLFERTAEGGFIAAEDYRKNALATFATHDLPTFAGWGSHRDLAIKRGLNIDPGESNEDRGRSVSALHEALRSRGITATDFAAVARYLGDAPSRLLVISMEDVLGLSEQVNVPGTIDEHPNWRTPLPVLLEELHSDPRLAEIAAVMRLAGRDFRGPVQSY